MSIKTQYLEVKKKLLNNTSINKENRELFNKFFEKEEYKLKRLNNLNELDNNCYRTLLQYGRYFFNVNKWFKNKAWKDLTKIDIKRVYDGLEDGKIKNKRGKPFKDTKSYYNKIFRSKPFEMAGKREMAREVMEFYKSNGSNDVRFVEEETVRKLINVAIKPEHKLLIWLSFDIGENINALLQLKKKHFTPNINPDTKEKEFIINLPKEILKRSRKERSEITNFSETAEFLDIVLKDLKEEDDVFPFGYGQAKKLLNRTVDITKAVCIPKGEKVSWKDLRSSMACYLLKQSWTTNEINKRLGHTPSSSEIDKYVNFLAIDRHSPKKKVSEGILHKVREELEEQKKKEKLYQNRIDNLQEEFEDSKKEMEIMKERLEAQQKDTERKLKRMEEVIIQKAMQQLTKRFA